MTHGNFLKGSAAFALLTLCVLGVFPLAASASNGTSDLTHVAASAECAGLPPGRHALLERMATAYGLTCHQQLKIEPLLHAEESVSKPLLRYTILSRQQERAMMLTVKIAARRQLLPLLTDDQRPELQRDIESLVATGKDDIGSTHKHGAQKGGRHNHTKNSAHSRHKPVPEQTPAELVSDEAALSQAIQAYAPLTRSEKTAMLLQVKRAALSDPRLPFTPAQRRKLEDEVQQLAKQGA